MRAALFSAVLGGGYDPAAAALFARFPKSPSARRKTLCNNLIVALRDGNVWDNVKNDLFYVLAMGCDDPGYSDAINDPIAARLNWGNSSYNLTAVNSPTFTTDRGYAGNGTTSYLNTTWPTNGGGNYLRNSASLGVWCRTSRAGNSMIAIGADNSQLYPMFSTGAVFTRVNDGRAGIAVANAQGFSAGDRSGASAGATYKNGSNIGATASSSLALSAQPFFIGAFNSAGTPTGFSTDQIAAAFTGGSLGDAGQLALYNALQTYMTAVGA